MDEVATVLLGSVHDDGLQDAMLADVFRELLELVSGNSVRGLLLSSSSRWTAASAARPGQSSATGIGVSFITDADDPVQGIDRASAIKGETHGSGSNPARLS